MFPDLDVSENVFMGRMPTRGAGRLDRERMRKQVAAVLEMVAVRLDPGRVARGLTIADQQIVEISKALTLDARILVMDEPTAALSAAEVERLVRVIETLRERGAAILFHLASPRGGVPHLPARHGDARRALGHVPTGRRADQ